MTSLNKVKSSSQLELDKAEQSFKTFDDSVKAMTLDRMNQAPKEDMEPQTKIAQKDLDNAKDNYLKPRRSIGSKEKFNEKYREDYEFSEQYVNFIAEHKEIIGDTIELWTKPYPGMPAEEWAIPTNVAVWGPRYLAERIKGCKHHRLSMKQNVSSGADGMGQYYGAMAVDTIVQRLDAMPVSSRRSIFMGADF